MKALKIFAFAAVAAVMAVSCGRSEVKVDVELPTNAEIDSVSYLLGVNYGLMFKQQGFAEKLSELTAKYLKEFAENGPTAEELAMALENLKKNVPESRINNSYWKNALSLNNEYGIDYDAEYEAALANVTAEDVKALLQSILAQGNFIQIVLAPQE